MSTPVHAFGDDALGTLDAVAVAAAIATGEVSRAEVTEAAIDRAEKVNPQINGIQVETFDAAHAQMPTGGAFSGVPSFIKDNTDVAGLPTCHGSAALTAHPVRRSSGPAQQFLSQGFTLLGKTTLPEFGLTASTEYADRPPTRNPWNLDHSAGASSGGSAALVAAGVVPIAHANDGGGSIRIPGAVNGLVGLKSTRARLLDQPGVRHLPVNLVSEGVVSRTVRDTAHYLAAAEAWQPNRTLPPIGLIEGPSDRRLRIGLVRRDVLGRDVHPETLAAIESAAKSLGARGHEISEVEVNIDPTFVEDFKLYWATFAILVSASVKAAHRSHFHPHDLDPFTRGLAGHARTSPARIVPAIRRLRGARKIYDAHFRGVDVLLTPVLSHPAPRIGELAPDQPFEELFAKLVDYVGFTPLNNVSGAPAIAVPHGQFSHGLPGSVHLAARWGREADLLDLAYQLEESNPFPQIAG